ncbi:MAG: apolipoprotein N-acyltransferase [Pseudomonadota bacterium]
MMPLLALALGLVCSLGFAPFSLWPLMLLAIAGFFWLLQRSRRPLLIAWLFGVGKYGLGASWVYVSIHVYGNAPAPLAAALVCLFVLAIALFCMPIGWLFQRLAGGAPGTTRSVLAFAVAWSLMDWLLTWFLTGFPWLFPGFALIDTWAAVLAPLVGVLGLSFLCVLTMAALTSLTLQRRWQWGPGLLVLGPLLVVLILQPIEWVQPTETKQVALIQNNLDQKRKWLPAERAVNLRKNLTLSEPHWGVDLMLWPEAAITAHPEHVPQLLEQLQQRAQQSNTNLVVGIPGVRPLPDGNYELQNLALGLGVASGRFAKHHLVPFGDYVPLENQLRGLIDFFDLPMSHASPGGRDQRNLRLSFAEAAMAICYEVAYGESMRRYASSAGLLLTISNDTWFGASVGPHQHLQIARMRALENGRGLLRATQNGITAIVDHHGAEVARLPQFVGAALRGEIQLTEGRTPYNRLGDWPLLVILAVLLLTLWMTRSRMVSAASDSS